MNKIHKQCILNEDSSRQHVAASVHHTYCHIYKENYNNIDNQQIKERRGIAQSL